MRYWDASALVPLVVEEPSSVPLRALARDGGIVTWCLSAVEIRSAIERRAREGALSAAGREGAIAVLGELDGVWTEITAVALVRERASRLLAVHALRAADALQLAAALVAAGSRPGDHEFVCTDARLGEAAAREGLRTARW
ncbi:MAG: PIN domain-containing protein [Deltaproteobacteria bacterium]|nr:PIN domain-containing protein [Deltaproteobacteria bacterium]